MHRKEASAITKRGKKTHHKAIAGQSTDGVNKTIDSVICATVTQWPSERAFCLAVATQDRIRTLAIMPKFSLQCCKESKEDITVQVYALEELYQRIEQLSIRRLTDSRGPMNPST